MEIFARDDCIFYVKELISQELCHTFIELYEDDPRKHPGYTASAGGERQLEANVKVSTDLDVETDGIWTTAFAELHSAVTTVILSIAAKFPSLQVSPLRCTGYKIHKNEGHFKWHFDALGPGGWDRQLAVIIYLKFRRRRRRNVLPSPESEGKTRGWRAGDALFFPTFWTHLHCGRFPSLRINTLSDSPSPGLTISRSSA
jgi:hypothetical protein